MQQRVLVVDDEADLVQVLQYNLERAGFAVITAARGRYALEAMKRQEVDLVLLDLMLPDMPGTDVCRDIKSDPRLATIPVIMLTARGEEIDRVVGFELGVDDYVVKPFSVRELILRAQALLRRGAARQTPTEIIEFGVLTIDTKAHRVWIAGKETALTTLELKLLVLLWERRNRVQTRSMLLGDVWGISADINTRTVDTHVKRLREKLASAADYIETVRGIGYRFASHAQTTAAYAAT